MTINVTNQSLPIRAWPQSLRHVLDRLERTTHKDYREVPTEDSSTRRLRSSSPFPMLKGEVWLSRAEWDALDECRTMGLHLRFDD